MGNERPATETGSNSDLGDEAPAIELDDGARTTVDPLTPVVGLGGSAGSIPALRRFFAAMPKDSGMAFVVILHLSPDHESTLHQLLQNTTSLPVQQASEGQVVLPNHVYVIPPGKFLSLTDGHLHLTSLRREHGKRLTVDLFFRSLAETHGPQAVGIVLSGLDGDGALGIKRVKELGGLTIAQDPDEAEQAGMPRAAIATDMVDWIMRVDQIPERLLRYRERQNRIELPPDSGPNPAPSLPPAQAAEEAALRDVLAFLHGRTGHDFSYYKRASVVRRIARRMQVNDVAQVSEYLTYLRTHAAEAAALLQDLLISVTNFFRDPEAFDALAQQIPELFKNKTQADAVRVWVPACASGEEAYSIAILLSEHARTLDAPPSLQVFATDLDEETLAVARKGLYPATISTDVSPERLQHFFVKDHGGYRVKRELREKLLFAVHDLLKDSPFSRLDLVSCRNLLIYLNRTAQTRAFDIFHFALLPQGRLFLGTSESAEDGNQWFHASDKKHRIYSARITGRPNMPVSPSVSPPPRALGLRAAEPGTTLARRAVSPSGNALITSSRASRERISWSELHLKLIEQLAPPSLIVNEDADIVHLSDSASPFLKFAGGEPSVNLFRLIHPMLRAELRAALFRARQSGEPSNASAVAIDLGEMRQVVDIRVAPAPTVAPDMYLITLAARQTSETPASARDSEQPLVRQLERELELVKQQWRDIVDDHESSTEELKASNEELHAMNEELRSATEELETGREELQSINEELTTVNLELKSKVDELAHANSDLRNLMGATAIATVFLDRELNITRFTPPAVELFSLISSDVGRPLAHLRHRLIYPKLLSDAAQVLEHLGPLEREVEEEAGRFFLARLLPYKTGDDRIAGVVLTFVDVTDLHVAQEAARHARRELEVRVKERTAELGLVNSALRKEVAMHQQAQQARHELQARLVNAQEEERGRLSRELHDEVGQQITALMLAIKSLESAPPTAQTPAKLRELRAAAERVGREIHQLASELRPAALDELGLSRALSGYLDSWSERSGILVDFLSAGIDEPRLPGVVETTLYRVVQEAMNNVFKHASAKSVSVSIERRGSMVLAIVEDDGMGFDPDALPSSTSARLGIAGMRERAIIAGGMLTVESSSGGGTTVRLQVPLPTS